MSVEIEIEAGKTCDCGKMGAKTAEPTKDSLLAELKNLIGVTDDNGRAERQMKIDELISKINEMSSED